MNYRYARLKTEYLCYLMNRAMIDSGGSDGYSVLCGIMLDTRFLPIVEMDENRSYECRSLRRDFADDYDHDAADILDGLLDENGTVMELFVVLAEKMNYDLADSEYEASTGKWFKEMLQNCGLIEMTNDALNSAVNRNEVTDILSAIVYRHTGWDGEGGMFPLRWARTDQRYEELIVQMNNYIEENYDIC